MLAMRADDGHALLHRGRCGALRRLGRGVAHQAADGQQKQAAQLQAEPCGGDGTRNFAYDYCKQQNQPQGEAAAARHAGDGGITDRQGQATA